MTRMVGREIGRRKPWNGRVEPGHDKKGENNAGGATCRMLYTEMCGDSGSYPSNLHDCHPISGRQHESTVGGGNGSVSAQAVGRQAISRFFGPLLRRLRRAGAPSARASFCVLKV